MYIIIIVAKIFAFSHLRAEIWKLCDVLRKLGLPFEIVAIRYFMLITVAYISIVRSIKLKFIFQKINQSF